MFSNYKRLLNGPGESVMSYIALAEQGIPSIQAATAGFLKMLSQLTKVGENAVALKTEEAAAAFVSQKQADLQTLKKQLDDKNAQIEASCNAEVNAVQDKWKQALDEALEENRLAVAEVNKRTHETK